MFDQEETIIAQATARGSGIRGILRLSGANGICALADRFSPDNKTAAQWDSLLHHSTRSDESNTIETAIFNGTLNVSDKNSPDSDRINVPCSLYYWGENRGYTGQSSVELHLPGCQPLLDRIVRILSTGGLLRLAQPGEFTLRAFLSGRIDLTQAEAVLGVIDAVDENNLRTALGQLAGGLARPLAQLRENMLQTVSEMEAGFDFADEEIEFISHTELQRRTEEALSQIRQLLHQMSTRSDGAVKRKVVLLGLPNAGKSSLFNALGIRCGQTAENAVSGNERDFDQARDGHSALVSSIAGTTRDYLERDITVSGFPLTLVDTAGHESEEPATEKNGSVEEEEDRLRTSSQKAAESVQRHARLLLLCIRADRFLPDGVFKEEKLTDWEQALLADTANVLPILTQIDRGPVTGGNFLPVSTLTGEGLDHLTLRISELLRQEDGGDEALFSSSVRCRQSLSEAEKALDRALILLQNQNDDVLTASELRIALDQLGLVTGAVHTEDILDRIFSHFCLGK